MILRLREPPHWKHLSDDRIAHLAVQISPLDVTTAWKHCRGEGFSHPAPLSEEGEDNTKSPGDSLEILARCYCTSLAERLLRGLKSLYGPRERYKSTVYHGTREVSMPVAPG